LGLRKVLTRLKEEPMAIHVWKRATTGAAALLVAACATGYSAERGKQLEDRVDRLESEGAQPRTDADRAAAREQMKQLDARVASLESRLKELTAAAQRAPEAQQGTVDRGQAARLSEELGRVRKQLDEQSRKLDTTDRAVARLQTDLAQRPPATTPPKRAGRATTTTRPETAAAPPPEAAPKATDAQGRTEMLALGREQESKGQRAAAKDLYEEYVRQFPSDPGAAEARYRLGELAFSEKRYQDAIVEFGRVAQDFPRAERAPDALLRSADSMLAIGLNDDARTVLSDIPRRYPNSGAAARARQRLTQLGATGKP
jgi:tol-pal system protein YbgF